MQCPPETSSAVWGNGTSRSARYTLARWPSRWLTPTTGTPQPSASALAVAMPTSSAPTRPGPDGHRHGVEVAAGHAGVGEGARDDRGDRLDVGPARQLGDHARRTRRAGRPGSPPPRSAPRSVSSTTAAAVSSHDVSIASSSRVTTSRPAWPSISAFEIAPSRSTTGSGPAHVDQRRGHLGQRARRRRPGRPRGRGWPPRRPAVRGVGAPCGLALVTTSAPVSRQQRPQEVVVGDADGDLVAAGQPVRARRRRRAKPKASVSGPGPPPPRPACVRRGVNATPSARDLVDATRRGRGGASPRVGPWPR